MKQTSSHNSTFKTVLLVFSQYGPALIFMGLIFFFSSIPDNSLPELGGWKDIWDKLYHIGGHIIGYALFGFSLFRALNIKERLLQGSLFVALIGFTYALSDEFHQSFVPGRTASLKDICIDLIGVILALAFCYFSQYLRKWIRYGLN